jgi:hypothetical protein
VERAFNLVEQFRDVVQVPTGQPATKRSRVDRKSISRPLLEGRGESTTKRLVDDITKRAPGSADDGLQLCRDVVIERQGRPHIMMLSSRHHDVNWRVGELVNW